MPVGEWQCDLVTPFRAWPMFFGTALDLLLLGILTTQIYVYYLGFPGDRISIKLTIAIIYMVGLAQTAFAVLDIYRMSLCSHPGRKMLHTESTSMVHWWFSISLSSAIVAVFVQFFYAYRIKTLSGILWLPIFIVVLSLGQLAGGVLSALCYGIESILPLFFRNPVCHSASTIWGSLNVACDVTISVSMSVLLLKQRKGIFKGRTYAKVTKIIQLIIETGTVATITVFCYALLRELNLTPHFGIFFPAPGLAIGKIYSNSMLALLNNRMEIVGGRPEFRADSMVEDSLRFAQTEHRQESTITFRRGFAAEGRGTLISDLTAGLRTQS
ncbi:hypothetical protein D9756_006885 [Leucocoprinus leucothites]|uniref:DUF6534 domain-containing protein n=1 Tax=Leucocoprinus leucothites TaxID=201217 RepID=A0A8H5D5Y4_9AGAR|nr:hypothetical protein D9756_006885 [Leucoagaricus leucothites]